MAWISLILAGICEMIGVGMINKWHHDRKWSSLLFLILGFGTSFFFLSIAFILVRYMSQKHFENQALRYASRVVTFLGKMTLAGCAFLF